VVSLAALPSITLPSLPQMPVIYCSYEFALSKNTSDDEAEETVHQTRSLDIEAECHQAPC
jgi:hypothetical protein